MPIKLFLEFRRSFFIGFTVGGIRNASIFHLLDSCNEDHLFSLEVVHFLFKSINLCPQLLILFHDHHFDWFPFFIQICFQPRLQLLYFFLHFLGVWHLLLPFFPVAYCLIRNVAKDIFELTHPFAYFCLFLCHQIEALYHCFGQALQRFMLA